MKKTIWMLGIAAFLYTETASAQTNRTTQDTSRKNKTWEKKGDPMNPNRPPDWNNTTSPDPRRDPPPPPGTTVNPTQPNTPPGQPANPPVPDYNNPSRPLPPPGQPTTPAPGSPGQIPPR